MTFLSDIIHIYVAVMKLTENNKMNHTKSFSGNYWNMFYVLRFFSQMFFHSGIYVSLIPFVELDN